MKNVLITSRNVAFFDFQYGFRDFGLNLVTDVSNKIA